MKEDGYRVKSYSEPVKRYCQTLDLKENPELIERYKYLHSSEASWKDIRDGIRQVRILEMEIYIIGSRLFMVVETPLDFNWDESMAKLATLPRQQEWECVVAEFQKCEPGATSSEKWRLMERMFYLYE